MVPLLKSAKIQEENNIRGVSRKLDWTSPGGMPPTGEFAKPPSVDSSLDLGGLALRMWM